MRANSNVLKRIRAELNRHGLNVFGSANDYLTFGIYCAYITIDEPVVNTKEFSEMAIGFMEHKPSVAAFKKGVARAITKLYPEPQKYIDTAKECYILAQEIE